MNSLMLIILSSLGFIGLALVITLMIRFTIQKQEIDQRMADHRLKLLALAQEIASARPVRQSFEQAPASKVIGRFRDADILDQVIAAGEIYQYDGITIFDSNKNPVFNDPSSKYLVTPQGLQYKRPL